MTLFVDTSVWSLAFRRGAPSTDPTVTRLRHALAVGEEMLTTGLVLQELLQGLSGPVDRPAILDRFAGVPLLVADRDDHVEAAGLRNDCRRRGIQVGTIDALLARLCIRHGLTMLTTDQDFDHIARHTALRVWERPA